MRTSHGCEAYPNNAYYGWGSYYGYSGYPYYSQRDYATEKPENYMAFVGL